MKKYFKSWLTLAVIASVISSCDKVGDLPYYESGSRPVLSASTNTLIAQAADSLSDLVTFSWTYPKYATDSAGHKYILQIDTAGNGFANARSREIMGALSTTFTAMEMNDLLFSLGFKAEITYGIEARVISSYGNNNDRLISDAISLNARPYKIPPKVELPFTNKLYIVGGATLFGWDNTAPFPAVRELTRLDETTWAGIYYINASSGYLLLPEAGSWSNKYSVQDNSIPGAANAGSFGYNLPQDFPGSVAQGPNWYKMTFDFQLGRYTIVKEDNAMKNELFITGDATPSGWTNSPPASQQLTMITNGIFEITMALVPGKLYKFLDTNGAWQPQFGGSQANGGDLGANYGGGNDPNAIPTPASAGTYKIRVDFLNKKYSVTPI